MGPILSSILLIAAILMGLPSQSLGQGVITLVQKDYVVTEGRMFSVRIRKAGIAASSINAVVEIVNPDAHGGQDFVGISQAIVFPAGRAEVERFVSFTIKNDDLAEPDETFDIILKVTNGNGIVGTPNRGTVTIAANDDAFGVFSIEEPLPNVVTESKDISPNYAVFTVRRIGGIFGAVIIAYEVKGISEGAEVGADVTPPNGQILFQNEQTTAQIRLEIIDDDIPENDETFLVNLTEAIGGQSIDPTAGGPRIVAQSASLIIRRNDAPLRFAQAEYNTDEKSERSDLTLTIYRGLNAEGTNIVGAITEPATVGYFFVSQTATMLSDFIGSNGTVGFRQGATQSTITVQILPDDIPEKAEVFEIHLADPSGDVVIIEPSVARVVIEPNDEPNGVLRIEGADDGDANFYIDEDETNQYGGLVVTRGEGRFGRVTVDWTLTRLDSNDEDVVTDLNPNFGTLVFEDGVEDVPVLLNVVGDRAPEPTERFRFDLLPGTVTGGARVNGVTSATIVLEDSDDIYGVVDLGGENLQTFESMALPRVLELAVVRTGGSLGAIQVKYIAEYIVNGTASTGPFLQVMPASIILQDGQLSQVFSITIKDNAFLEFGALFRITLQNVDLITDPPFGAYNSPRLGLSRILDIAISEEAANGVIGFEDTSTRKLIEPDGIVIPFLEMPLVVKREGTNGVASLEWTLEGVGSNADKVTHEDTGPTFGRVTMESGQDRVTIFITILPDDIPETDEMIRVSLIRVSPEGTQRIKNGADQVDLLIQENDMPGGVFEFGLTMAPAYVVEEEGAAIDITVVRYGGSLTERYIQHIIEPAGEVEFYGATYVMKFEPGETVKNSTVIAKSDGVAELIEHFQLRLVRFGESQAVIGKKNTVNITVLENDDPYGVIHFSPESLDMHLDESNILLATRDWVNVTVVRSRGLFNTVTVRWHVIGIETVEDIGPLSGLINFSPGQKEALIRLQSIADDIPEGPERFYINLTDPTGGAVIGEPRVASVTVSENDHPIFFKEPSVVRVKESGQVTLTVAREGSLDVEVKVRFRTVDGVASSGDHDYVPLEETVITFSPGQSEHTFIITTLEDSLPETDEPFYVILYDPAGDVSVFGGDRATVIIEANDNANGIFHFIPPFKQSTKEGVAVEFDVKRDEGIFSEVQVHWEVLYKDTLRPAVDDFEEVRGNVSFQDQQQVSPLTIIPAADTIPEYSEFFIIRLTDVTGGGPSGQVGILADTGLEVELEVLQNDDPSGVFVFPPVSREISLPEDVNPGEEIQTRVQLTVARNQGSVGEVAVAWEIFSYQIASAGKLPRMRDLLFLGDFPPEVTEVPEQRRPETGSTVLSFSGCDVCWGAVPQDSQLSSETVENGFSISAWVKPFAETDGYILAKTSPEGSRHYYALKLTTSSTSMNLEFRYSVPNSRNNQGVALAMNVNLQDGAWHHLLVTIDSALAEFFIDGQTQTSRRLLEETTLDGPGPLTVGAITPGAEHYTGLMQDVRLFARKLDLGEIQELYETPSQKDVRPISGSLRYREGEAVQTLTVFSKDDNEEEANELFAVRLISARGGARVSDTDSIAELTVLKSDNANGLFGISGPCISLSPGEEDSVWSCPVNRNRGDADFVTLSWRLVGPIDIVGERLASRDFINATGTLEFEAGDRENEIIFEGLDDDIPELSQTFRLELTNAESRDGLIGTTPTSGASIDPDAARTEVVVPDNDYPYGLLEFSTGAPPNDGDPRIPPSTGTSIIRVLEEAGSVRLLVVRAQGLVGEVTVEWRTLDGTAVSSGKTNPDYEVTITTNLTSSGGGQVVPSSELVQVSITLHLHLYHFRWNSRTRRYIQTYSS